MPDLFIEFLSEEIPSRMQKEGAFKLKGLITKNLENEEITFGKEEVFFSSRRIGLNLVNVDLVRSAGFKVVLDAVNVISESQRRICREYGVVVETIGRGDGL